MVHGTVRGRALLRLSRRLGPTFVVEKLTVRGVPGTNDCRTYTARITYNWPLSPKHEFTVQADGRTCPYDVLVIKARMLAELTPER
jgi:hypothetical protein